MNMASMPNAVAPAMSVRKASRSGQIPWESTSLEADFAFLPSPVSRDLAREFEQDLATWMGLRTSRNPGDFEAFIRLRPNGKFAEMAQFRLDQLLAARGDKPVIAAVTGYCLGGGIDIQLGGDIGSTIDGGGSTDGGSTGADIGADTAANSGTCEFVAKPAAGEPGSACKTNEDCASGFCIDTWGGRVCTRSCGSCCPKGYGCEQFGSGDSVFVCVTKNTAECRPCNTDSECDAVSKGALCIDYGGNGRFCGGGCETVDDCPAGTGISSTALSATLPPKAPAALWPVIRPSGRVAVIE